MTASDKISAEMIAVIKLESIPSKKTIKNNVVLRPKNPTAFLAAFCRCLLQYLNSSPAKNTARVILMGSSNAVRISPPLQLFATVTAKMPQQNKKASRFSSTLCTVSGSNNTTKISKDKDTVCQSANSIFPSCSGGLPRRNKALSKRLCKNYIKNAVLLENIPKKPGCFGGGKYDTIYMLSRSSSGPGRRPLKAEITSSNLVRDVFFCILTAYA